MKKYLAIDLKSFYASVECVERGFDPLTTNLVVADESRTEKTICLAISPSLKAYGLGGRARLFEVIQRVKEVNRERKIKNGGREFVRESYFDEDVRKDPNCALSFYIATPRMAYYMSYSSKIYDIYLKYISSEDIHVYSIDEVFIDATDYLKTYKLNAHQLCMKMVKDVLKHTGITATAGIGTNLYLAKIAMDIVAKHKEADKDGVRIAELDEYSFRKLLWNHQPLSDFWNIGPGITRRLNKNGMYTIGDVAKMSLVNEEKLYKIFGVNAELIIDHAWGIEPVTIKDIKDYVPVSNSLSVGQVLKEPYSYDKGLLIIKEMTESLVLDMVDKNVKTDQMVINIMYDNKSPIYEGVEMAYDMYGRPCPKPVHGSINLGHFSYSTREIREAVVSLYKKIVDSRLLVRRLNICASHIVVASDCIDEVEVVQYDLFSNAVVEDERRKKNKEFLKKEEKEQKAILKIQKKYGKNAIFKGNNLEEGATGLERNQQIGGHKG